jgi:hypothetical protein
MTNSAATDVVKWALLASTSLLFTANAAQAETLGFALTTWHIAGAYTDDAKECAHGVNPDARENFRAQFKTKEEQEAAMRKFASVGYIFRGPNGENMNYSPEIVQDYLPWSDADAKVSPGLDLDGSANGAATAKTCAHTPFTSPDGQAGIDNQMYRVVGCIRGMRPGNLLDTFYNGEIASKIINRWLVEVTDVDDRVNDDQVKVTLAHGLDKLVQDANGKFVPGLTQRMTKNPDYIATATGRIVDGVLITDPFPVVHIPTEQLDEPHEWEFKDFQFRLKLSENGASGVIGAYQDIGKFYRQFAKVTGQHHVSMGASPPSVYRSLIRHADGFKDPATGQCTAISSAYEVEFVRAFIVREPGALKVAGNTPAAVPRPAASR